MQMVKVSKLFLISFPAIQKICINFLTDSVNGLLDVMNRVEYENSKRSHTDAALITTSMMADEMTRRLKIAKAMVIMMTTQMWYPTTTMMACKMMTSLRMANEVTTKMVNEGQIALIRSLLIIDICASLLRPQYGRFKQPIILQDLEREQPAEQRKEKLLQREQLLKEQRQELNFKREQLNQQKKELGELRTSLLISVKEKYLERLKRERKRTIITKRTRKASA